jgi:hypothetical protein
MVTSHRLHRPQGGGEEISDSPDPSKTSLDCGSGVEDGRDAALGKRIND